MNTRRPRRISPLRPRSAHTTSDKPGEPLCGGSALASASVRAMAFNEDLVSPRRDQPLLAYVGQTINCIQTVTVRGSSGLFILRNEERGRSTLDLPLGSSAATVQAELVRLYGVGNVLVTSYNGGARYVVEFCGELAGVAVPLMQADADFLFGADRTCLVEMTQSPQPDSIRGAARAADAR